MDVDNTRMVGAFYDNIVVISPGTYQRCGSSPEELKINKMPLQNARASGLLGDETAPDACFKNCKGARGYVVTHVNSQPETLVKLLLTATTIAVFKYIPPPQRKRTRSAAAAAAVSADASPSGWLPLRLEEITNTKQLLETMAWMCLCLRLKPADLTAPELQPLLGALEKTQHMHETAVLKLRSAAAAKRSETAEKKAIIEKKKALAAAAKISKTLARFATGDDDGAEEEKQGSDDDEGDDSDDGEEQVTTTKTPASKKRRVQIQDDGAAEEEVYTGPKTVACLLKELAKRSKKVKTLKADLKHVIKRRNTQATIAFLGQARQKLDDQLLRLMQNERQWMTSKTLREDLKTVVNMDGLGENSDEDTEEQDEEESREEGEEKENENENDDDDE